MNINERCSLYVVWVYQTRLFCVKGNAFAFDSRNLVPSSDLYSSGTQHPIIAKKKLSLVTIILKAQTLVLTVAVVFSLYCFPLSFASGNLLQPISVVNTLLVVEMLDDVNPGHVSLMQANNKWLFYVKQSTNRIYMVIVFGSK